MRRFFAFMQFNLQEKMGIVYSARPICCNFGPPYLFGIVISDAALVHSSFANSPEFTFASSREKQRFSAKKSNKFDFFR